MNKNINKIDELLLLDDIEYIAEEYKHQYGQYPVNLSNWNVSNSLIDANYNLIIPNSCRSASDYIFSYSLNHSNLISKLNYKSKLWKTLITHSGSSAILSVVKWLTSKDVKKVLIVCPRYFTVPHTLNSLSIEYEVIYCKRTPDGYELPQNIKSEVYDAIWITNPIYCTGEYLDKDNLENIYNQWTSNKKYFVMDNCLSNEEYYFGLDIEPNPNICIIVSPSKNLCINAYKFASILFHKDELHHFECWSDVLQGCLPESSVQALEFFTHGQYDTYKKYFNRILGKQEKVLYDLLSDKKVEIDKNAKGYLRTVYFSNINAELGQDIKFLKKIFFTTGASFIPNIRNELCFEVGFSFRVNLLTFDIRAQGGLIRTVDILSNL